VPLFTLFFLAKCLKDKRAHCSFALHLQRSALGKKYFHILGEQCVPLCVYANKRRLYRCNIACALEHLEAILKASPDSLKNLYLRVAIFLDFSPSAIS